MKVRTLVLATVLGVGLMAAAPGTASAHIIWCAGDPPVQVLTPGGHYMVVNNYLYVSLADRHLAKEITADASVAPDGAGGTVVTVRVHAPRGLEDLFVISAQQHYRVETSGSGPGGTDITLVLDVPES